MCQPTTPTTPTVVEAPLSQQPAMTTNQQDLFGFPSRRSSRRPSLAPIDEDSETTFDSEEEDDSISQQLDPFSSLNMSDEFFCAFQSLPPFMGDDEDSQQTKSSSSADTNTIEPPRRQRKRVQFSTVSIRHYDVQVGDNVPIKAGVPLQLDWYYEEQPTVALDDYESNKKGPPKKPRQFRLSPHERWDILTKAGFDTATLNQARKEAFQVRAQRKLSNVLLPADLTFQRLAASLL